MMTLAIPLEWPCVKPSAVEISPSEISVVIGTHTEERWHDLLAAVDSVHRQNCPPREIIVVIDHNPALLKRAEAVLTHAVVISNNQARGLSGVRNSGVAAAQGRVVAFMDDDAIAAPDWLDTLSREYRNPNVQGVGGSIEPLWSSKKPDWFPEEFQWVVGCTYRGMPKTAAPIRNLIGANMSFRREVFKTIGGFRLGYGCDETDFCIQVRQRLPGSLLIYQPRARVHHRVPQSRANWRYFSSRCYFEGGSKAVVAWLVGAKDGLASERSYTLKTLPQGFLSGLYDAWRDRDGAGLGRAAAIIVGLLSTSAGYMAGKTSVLSAARRRGWSGESR